MTTYARSGSALQGLRTPYALTIHITPGEKLPTLSAVTAASLSVYRSGSSTPSTWAASITSQSGSELVLSHIWITGDNDTPGTLTIYPILTASGESFVCEPVTVTITRR